LNTIPFYGVSYWPRVTLQYERREIVYPLGVLKYIVCDVCCWYIMFYENWIYYSKIECSVYILYFHSTLYTSHNIIQNTSYDQRFKIPRIGRAVVQVRYILIIEMFEFGIKLVYDEHQFRFNNMCTHTHTHTHRCNFDVM